MNKEDIIEKLKELGIVTTNCYPKSSFLHPTTGEAKVTFYRSELDKDFYFYNKFDKTIWKLPPQPDVGIFDQDERNGKTQYLVPLSLAEKVWEDKPFVELPDIGYKEMTLRHYACIQLRVPDSGLAWLDELIKRSRYEDRQGSAYFDVPG